MGLVRMFFFTCDASANIDCLGDSPGNYYSKTAIVEAKKDGWKLRGDLSICPSCYEAGARIVTSAVPKTQGKFRIRWTKGSEPESVKTARLSKWLDVLASEPGKKPSE